MTGARAPDAQSGPWALQRFDEALDNWRALQQPSEALLRTVKLWLASRAENPYPGARPDPMIEGQWFAEIPGTATHTNVVLCVYMVFAGERRVQCTGLSTLGRPVPAGDWADDEAASEF